MGQRTVAPATTARRGLPGPRALLLLGGFVLAWWLPMTGAASADEGPLGSGSDLGATAKGLNGKVSPGDSAKSQGQAAARPVDAAQPARPTAPPATVRGVRSSVRRVVVPVREPVTAVVRTTVRKTVRNVVKAVENTDSTSVKPVVRTATDTVRKTRAHLQPLTDEVRAGVRNLVARTTADLPVDLPIDPSAVPATDLSPMAVDPTVAASVSTALPGAMTAAFDQLPAVHHDSSTVPSVLGSVSAILADLDGGTDSATDRSYAGTPSDELRGLGVLTRLGATGASSAGSGSAPTAGAGTLVTGAPSMTSSATTTRFTDSDRRPAGPTYRPSCSPD